MYFSVFFGQIFMKLSSLRLHNSLQQQLFSFFLLLFMLNDLSWRFYDRDAGGGAYVPPRGTLRGRAMVWNGWAASWRRQMLLVVVVLRVCCCFHCRLMSQHFHFRCSGCCCGCVGCQEHGHLHVGPAQIWGCLRGRCSPRGPWWWRTRWGCHRWSGWGGCWC